MTTWRYPVELYDKQRQAVSADVDEVLFGGSLGGGKDLALDTPVLTTTGWKTQGTLQVGDYVYAVDGTPTRVIAAHPVESNPCYRIKFSTGETITAGEGHLWNVATQQDRDALRRRDPKWQARRRATRPSRATTNPHKGTHQQAVTAQRNRDRAAVARASQTPADPWDHTRTLETKDLFALHQDTKSALTIPRPRPISGGVAWPSDVPPYVLGMWLGDGSRNNAGITQGEGDLPVLLGQMEAEGFRNHNTWELTHYFRHVASGRTLDSMLNPIYGKTTSNTRVKHIPDWVYTTTYADRLAVIQGLFDADAHVNPRGQVEFCLTDRRLFEDAVRLLSTLGVRVSYRTGVAAYTKPNGTRVVTGTRYRTKFTTEAPVFRYPRKLARIDQGWTDPNHANRRSNITIESIEPCETVPTRCIGVEHPRALYLAGSTLVPTHNTEMILKHMVDICCLVPNAKTLVIRRSFPELREIAGRLKKRIPDSVASYNKSDHIMRFHHNGAELHLGYLDSEDDATRYQGLEFVKIGYDELSHYDKDWVALVTSRIRSTGQIADDMARNGFKMGTLSASNPGGRGHCVPYGEVLTPAGWVDIKTMQVGDPVFGVDQGGNLVPTVVEQVHRYDAPRTIEVNGRGTHMHMTPEHKVAKVGGVRSNRGAKFSLVPWKDLPGQATILRTVEWHGSEHGPVTVEDTCGLRKSRTTQPDTLTAEQYAELMGWFLSEGCLVNRDRAISIAQMKPAQRQRIKDFLDECGFTQSWSKTQVTLYARAWWKHFQDLDLGMCRDKYIPQGLKDATRPVLERLFAALMDGDGHWATRGRSGAYFTTSKRLADDVAEVALKLGYVVQVGSRQRENRVGLSWQVNFKTVKSGGTEYLTGNHVYDVETSTQRRSDTVTHDHDVPVPVYCIGVPEHHAFVIRQQGSVWVSGNSWVKESFIDPAPAEEPFTGEDGVRRVFIPSSLYDNPFIDHDDYVRRLGALDPERKRALIEGDWTIPAGTRFPQFRERVHVIKPEDFPIPPVGVVRVVGVDYGINDPFAAVWAAKVGDTIVVYRDHVQDGLAASQQAAKVLELESDEERLHSDVTVALDPNGWARNPHFGGKKLSPGADEAPLGSIAYSFRETLGDRVVKGWNPRVQGWAILDELMVERDTGMVDDDGNPVKLPRILIYDTCRELIRFMSSAPRAKRDPQDVDTTWRFDHVGDAARYCISELLGLSYNRPLSGHERLRLEGTNRSVTAGAQTVSF